MAKFREIPCKLYVCKGQCLINREAEFRGYCQKCDKYVPRAKVKTKNKKKEYNEKQRGKVEV